MAKKKLNIIKDLKKLGLVPTTKQYEQLMLVGTICLLVLITGLAMWGAWKYPIPHHYYDNMNYPANHYSNLAITDDIICECGNDPSCKEPWNLTRQTMRYHNYV